MNHKHNHKIEQRVEHCNGLQFYYLLDFLFYLCFRCKDVNGFVRDMRKILVREYGRGCKIP